MLLSLFKLDMLVQMCLHEYKLKNAKNKGLVEKKVFLHFVFYLYVFNFAFHMGDLIQI